MHGAFFGWVVFSARLARWFARWRCSCAWSATTRWADSRSGRCFWGASRRWSRAVSSCCCDMAPCRRLTPIHQFHIVPSSSRLTGSALGRYGYRAASASSMSTPCPGAVPGMQVAVVEPVGVREHRVGLRRVAHVFLDAEVGHPHVEVQRRAHAHRRQVGRAVGAGAHLVELGEVRDAAQMGDAAGVDDGRADVVDQLLADQLLGSPRSC